MADPRDYKPLPLRRPGEVPMDANSWAAEMLLQAGAVIQGSHVVYTSGKHGSAYVDKDAVCAQSQMLDTLADLLARRFDQSTYSWSLGKPPIEVVVAPAVAGITLGAAVTLNLLRRYRHYVRDVPLHFAYAEKVSLDPAAPFRFRPTYEKLIPGKQILLVEDVLNTGGSAQRVLDCIRFLGGQVVGVGAICNRGGVTAEQLGVPELYSLVDVTLDAWTEEDCPLCRQGVPINTQVGKGREFLSRKGK